MRYVIIGLALLAVPAALRAQVDTAWVRMYPSNESAVASAGPAAVDDSGNVFIAGTLNVPGQGSNFLVVKYGPRGDTLWSGTYNGSGSGNDVVRAMFLDGHDNVYLTGYATSSANGNPNSGDIIRDS